MGDGPGPAVDLRAAKESNRHRMSFALRCLNSVLLLATFVLPAAGLFGADEGPYHFITAIPAPDNGGWDYLIVDARAHRLYASHATEVVVIDTQSNAVVGTIPDTPGIHGIALAPKLNRAFTSNGRENKVGIVALDSLKTLAKVDAGTNPDCIVYDSRENEVYAFNGRSRSATVIGAETGQVVATLPLPGKPEFAVVDPRADRIYDNLEDKSQVAVIDPSSHHVVALWPIAPGESASGMALDREHHRLFLGCDNQLMVMMDSTTGKVVATAPIDEGVDANAYDPATGYAFASNSVGTITVAHEDSPERLTVIQTIKTARGCHTMALDPSTHRIYVPAAEFQPVPPDAPPHTRPKVVPGTFKILVFGL